MLTAISTISPVENVRRFEAELYQFVENAHPSIFQTIREKKIIDDALKAQIKDVISEFKQRFTSAATGRPLTCGLQPIGIVSIGSDVAMPSLIDIRRRIRSVKNTQQITKAMKMVSAAKLRRAQERVVAARPYGAMLHRVLSNVAAAAAGK